MGHTLLFLCFVIFFIEHWTFESNNVVILEIFSSSFSGFAGFFVISFAYYYYYFKLL